MILFFLTSAALILPGQSGGWGQTTVEGVGLGRPVPLHDQVGLPAVQGSEAPHAALDRPLRHVVRQMEQLPPPGTALPLPGPAVYDRFESQRPKPLSLDYIFIGPGYIEGAPGSKVIMNEIGFDYRLTKPVLNNWAFTFRPNVDILFLSGPGGVVPDIPAQLYKIAFDFQLDIPVNEVFGVSFGLTPGLWSDLIVVDGNDFRLPARGLMTYRFSDTLFIAAGIVYTDNIRRNLLPAGGIIWDPLPAFHVELLYPRSRLVYRFKEDIGFYVAFEQGGTTYNIRTYDADQDMEYRDLRLTLGTEITRWSPLDFTAEVGFAFDRKFRFDSYPRLDIGDSFFLRIGTRF